MYNKCCVISCGSRRKNVNLFRFPKSETGLKKWLQFINCDRLRSLSSLELKKVFVCKKHFEKRFLASTHTRSRLIVGAYPTLFSESEIAYGVPEAAPFVDSTKDAVCTDHDYPKKRQHQDHCYYKVEVVEKRSRIENGYDAHSVDGLEEQNVTPHTSYYQSFGEEVLTPGHEEPAHEPEIQNDVPGVSVVVIQEPAEDSTDPGPTVGEEIHEILSNLWQPLLKKGMSKESKEKILKEYCVPSNCTLLRAPKLNVEISAAVNETARLRDKKIESAQQQLGAGITAASRALTSLLNPSGCKVETIKTLSDACHILCDLHYNETTSRIKTLTPGLTKPFLAVIRDSDRDETLFGSDLSEKIKASKTIGKQGMQIKKSAPSQ